MTEKKVNEDQTITNENTIKFCSWMKKADEDQAPSDTKIIINKFILKLTFMTTGPPDFCTFRRSVLSLLCTYAFYCGEALLKSCEQRSYITLSCGRMQELSCECINFDIEIKSQTRKKKKSRISVWKTWAAGIGSCCNRISENPFVLATANQLQWSPKHTVEYLFFSSFTSSHECYKKSTGCPSFQIECQGGFRFFSRKIHAAGSFFFLNKHFKKIWKDCHEA